MYREPIAPPWHAFVVTASRHTHMAEAVQGRKSKGHNGPTGVEYPQVLHPPPFVRILAAMDSDSIAPQQSKPRTASRQTHTRRCSAWPEEQGAQQVCMRKMVVKLLISLPQDSAYHAPRAHCAPASSAARDCLAPKTHAQKQYNGGEQGAQHRPACVEDRSNAHVPLCVTIHPTMFFEPTAPEQLPLPDCIAPNTHAFPLPSLNDSTYLGPRAQCAPRTGYPDGFAVQGRRSKGRNGPACAGRSSNLASPFFKIHLTASPLLSRKFCSP